MNAIDLFAGCGGMSSGFQNAGFNILAAFDSWDSATRAYNDNFSHGALRRDLSKPKVIEELMGYDAEVVIGGPPCQDFSIAGKGNHNGDRANLTVTFAKIVRVLGPRYFVMENVYNIERKPILEKAINVLRRAGYGLTYRVFDASLMGVPQMRQRFFMIGKLGAMDNFILEELNCRLSEKSTTVYDYLGNSLGTEFYYMHPRSYARRAIFSIHEPSMTIRGVNRPMPKNYEPHPADKTTNLRQVRSLTTAERSYIQTFPKSFKWNLCKTENEQLIGNAVPVLMAEYIAESIIRYENRLTNR